jgi:hypothetical protein
MSTSTTTIGSETTYRRLYTGLWALGVVEWPLWLTPIAFFVAALTFVHVGSTMYESARAA